MPKRILVINPIISRIFDEFCEEYLAGSLSEGFELRVENLDFGTETIETAYDETIVAPYVVEKILDAERRGFAAVVISCFLDPGLRASREVARIPVIGPGESSMLLSLLLGDSFSILDVGAGVYRQYAAPWRVRELGIESRFRSAWGTSIRVADIPSDPARVAQELIPVAKQIRKDDQPDVLILGCTGLSMVSERIRQSLDIPVIDASVAALTMAEMCVRGNWLHSSKTYPAPSRKQRRMPEGYQLYQPLGSSNK